MNKFNEHYKDSKYEILGAYMEYYVDNKYMGSIDCEMDTERKRGYAGREIISLDETIKTNTKKVIKKGTEVLTVYCLYYGPMLNWNETHYEKKEK